MDISDRIDKEIAAAGNPPVSDAQVQATAQAAQEAIQRSRYVIEGGAAHFTINVIDPKSGDVAAALVERPMGDQPRLLGAGGHGRRGSQPRFSIETGSISSAGVNPHTRP